VRRFDVAIIGAGPAGSSSAIFLARRGYSIALIDKAVFPRDKLCGDFLNPAGWNLFERLGIRDALLASEHEKIAAFRVSTPAAEAVVPFPERCGVGISRRTFDHLLVKQAIEEGAILFEGLKLNMLERCNGGWRLRGEMGERQEEFSARLIIAADGRNSWAARRLGADAPGAESGDYVGFQWNLTGCRAARGEIQIHLFPGGYGGLMALGGGAANLSFAVEKSVVRENPVKAVREKYLERNPHLKAAIAGCAVAEVRSIYPLALAPRRPSGDGFMLVGDAARVTEPVTGEGVYFALKSGELAADVADGAFARGDLSEKALAPYDAACRRSLARREFINRLIRALVYRPRLTTPLVRLSAAGHFPINVLVNQVCRIVP
jgi:geranylgeranyl reductase family protein